MIEYIENDGLREMINNFDKEHNVMQIILIGEDGVIKNIYLRNEKE